MKPTTDSALRAEILSLQRQLDELKIEEIHRHRQKAADDVRLHQEEADRAWYERYKNARTFMVDCTNRYFVWAADEQQALERIGASTLQVAAVAKPVAESVVPSNKFPIYPADPPSHWPLWSDYRKKFAELREKFDVVVP